MKYLKLYFVVISILIISGCAHHHQQQNRSLSDESYIQRYNSIYNETVIANFQNKLESEGVKFISVGQDYMLIIPGDSIFYPTSPRIKWKSYTILNDVADYLRCFKKVNVRVSAYSTGKDSIMHDQLLSTARARNISNYLWSQDIDARLIAAEGFSSNTRECVKHCGKVDKLNSRIEISFRNELV